MILQIFSLCLSAVINANDLQVYTSDTIVQTIWYNSLPSLYLKFDKFLTSTLI